MKNPDYDFLRKCVKENPYLVHASNIVGKHNNKKYRAKLPILDLFAREYIKYLKTNLELSGYDRDTIKKRVMLLNVYYDYFARYDNTHTQKIEDVFNAQSKFRSTVLEEFLSILMRDVLKSCTAEIENCQIQLGSVKAYANLYFYGRNFKDFAQVPSIGINEKDQDFAIYRNVKIQMDGGRPIQTSVPVVAIECKTYIDKTMFEGAAATAEKLKAGNPYTMFGIVTETYEIDKSFIPAYSRVDQVYVLRKGSRKGDLKPIDCDVVFSFVNDVVKHLQRQWVDIEKKLEQCGLLI